MPSNRFICAWGGRAHDCGGRLRTMLSQILSYPGLVRIGSVGPLGPSAASRVFVGLLQCTAKRSAAQRRNPSSCESELRMVQAQSVYPLRAQPLVLLQANKTAQHPDGLGKRPACGVTDCACGGRLSTGSHLNRCKAALLPHHSCKVHDQVGCEPASHT